MSDSDFESQVRVFKERGLDKYLDENVERFKQIFQRLQELRLLSANNENFEEAYHLFYEIVDAVPLLSNKLSDVSIFRAQTNKPNELFKTQGRISYNKTNSQIIGPGKFNVWYEPMFYGSLPYKPQNENGFIPPSLTSCLEACKKLSDKSIKVLIQDFTVGRWKIRAPFDAVNLCFDEVHLSHNSELNTANQKYIESITANLTSCSGDFVLDLFRYYSSLCRTGRDEGAYYILTALFATIRIYYSKNHGLEIGALISSSAATKGLGLNIVLTPSTVDKHLLLSAVGMYRYFLVMPEADSYSLYRCTETIENHLDLLDFNYQFNQYIRPAERFLQKL